jgi:hypothetical protein
MTHREEMIETGAKVLATLRPEPGRRKKHEQVAAILDSIQPQIRTLEQLEALPSGSWLIDRDGDPAIKIKRFTVIDGRDAGGPYEVWTTEEFAEVCLPASVVWQPKQEPQPEQETRTYPATVNPETGAVSVDLGPQKVTATMFRAEP